TPTRRLKWAFQPCVSVVRLSPKTHTRPYVVGRMCVCLRGPLRPRKALSDGAPVAKESAKAFAAGEPDHRPAEHRTPHLPRRSRPDSGEEMNHERHHPDTHRTPRHKAS